MDVGEAIAIAAAVLSLAGTIFNAVWTSRVQTDLAVTQSHLDRETRREERELTAKAELDRVREPLLAASVDLAERLDNIRNEYFLDAYQLSTDDHGVEPDGHGVDADGQAVEADLHRGEIARLSTFYRFACYWCVVEGLYDNVALLKLQQDAATRPVADLLREIGRTFSSDSYDGARFMMWREEQRAVAELMRTDEGPRGCLGFATFVQRYDRDFSRWFAAFGQDLQAAAARTSERFAVLQHTLAQLAGQLDQESTHRDMWESLLADAE
jgi:hypothetical protein